MYRLRAPLVEACTLHIAGAEERCLLFMVGPDLFLKQLHSTLWKALILELARAAHAVVYVKVAEKVV